MLPRSLVAIDRKRHYDSRMNDAREFHDGQKDGLVALESLDLDKVKSFAGLLRAM